MIFLHSLHRLRNQRIRAFLAGKIGRNANHDCPMRLQFLRALRNTLGTARTDCQRRTLTAESAGHREAHLPRLADPGYNRYFIL